MPKAKINTSKALSEPGTTETHYGYLCVVQEDGGLIADIPDGLFEIEVEAGRATPVDAATKRARKE